MSWWRRTGLDAATGAVVGAAATVPMSAVMLLAERLGLMGDLPPRRITDHAVAAAHLAPPERERQGLAVLGHLGFGAAAAVPFAVLAGRLPRSVPPEPVAVGYALLVWASAYLGWVPALGIMPSAERDRPDRPAVMVAAHVVYGAALGAGARVLRRR